MPQSIPHGLTREHVLKALADFEAGLPHAFGNPTKFELVHQGKRHAPKAVIGLACRHLLGHIHYEFSGGEAPGQANYVLRQLGFTVVRKGEKVEEDEESLAGKDWLEGEVALVVADYFDMLRKELFGQAYNKTSHRSALRLTLAGRTDSSVEFKHANISAVLVSRGLPYIEGYKPRGNFQGLLADAVDSYLDQNPDYLKQLANAPALDPEQAAPADLDDVFVPRPDRIVLPEPGKPWRSLKGRRIDFVERDAANRRLGQLGEEFVVGLERRRLLRAERDDLAQQVKWMAKEVGEGLGYDVLSFDEVDDAQRLLEVKTTGLGLDFPFYVTANEVRCSEDVGARYFLYRVFDFARAPKVYTLNGSLRQVCRLEPVQFLAALEPAVR